MTTRTLLLRLQERFQVWDTYSLAQAIGISQAQVSRVLSFKRKGEGLQVRTLKDIFDATKIPIETLLQWALESEDIYMTEKSLR